MKIFQKFKLLTLLIISEGFVKVTKELINCLSYNYAKISKGFADDKCIGKHQPPFDIRNNSKIKKVNFPPILFDNFETLPIETILENDNHNVIIRMKYKNEFPEISSGPLKGNETFRFDRIYFRWLEIADKSSSNTLNEIMAFPAEIHAVFYNTNYANASQAETKDNAIAIFTFGIRINPSAEYSYDALQQNLRFITKPYSKTTIANQALIEWLTAGFANYFTYTGSMLAHVCDINVIWMDFLNPIDFKPDIAKEFQHLHADDDDAPLMEKVDHVLTPDGHIYEYSYVDDIEGINSMDGIPLVNGRFDPYENDFSNEGNTPESSQMKVNVFLILFYIFWYFY